MPTDKAAWEAFKASEDSMERVSEHVASGESLLSFTNAAGFNYTTVLNWIEADADRSENYARAKIAREEFYFDRLDGVARDAIGAESAIALGGYRLESDNIKWKLARMAPKKYGDKITQEHTGADGGPVQTVTRIELVAPEVKG